VNAAASTSPTTRSFVQSATIANNFEMQAAQIALRNSGNDEIKQFAQEMVDDHAQLASQMKAAVSAAHITAGQATSPLDGKHRKVLEALRTTTGDAFDDMYVKTQVDAHNDAVKLFTDYAQNGENPALKDFAAKTLPTLRHHKEQADEFKESF
jgi:putative membrane protein